VDVAEPRADAFRHEALFYSGEDDFVARVVPLIRDGVAKGEPTLVVVSARKLQHLRDELGRDAEGVSFADMATVGHNPARIIPAWQQFVARHAAPAVRLRGIGEPVDSERARDELVECQRHESLLNLAFAEERSFWLVCPYDTSALAPEVIDEARRSHPVVTLGDRTEPSARYHGLEGVASLMSAVLPAPPADAAELKFDSGLLERLRHVVAEYAAHSGVEMSRRVQLVVAVNEVAANSVKHGGGRGVLRVWTERRRRIVCEVRDRGQIADALADRRIPPVDEPRGRGLWMANQLCDLVQVRSAPSGTTVRLHFAI
jgi:anti-sigma regulatory factor (Ser/Thr protein kinase)